MLNAGQDILDTTINKMPSPLVFRLFLTPDHFCLRETFQFLDQGNGRERIELFHTQQIDVVDAALVALFQKVEVDLAGTHHDALDLVVGSQLGVRVALLRIVPKDAVEGRTGCKVFGFRNAELVTQQRLRCHQNQRLTVGAVQLATQDVEVVRRGRAVGNDPVVLTTHLQEAFKARGRVFRALTFKAVRQKANQTGHPQPFRFTRRDELVEHDLRTVGEVAELGFP